MKSGTPRANWMVGGILLLFGTFIYMSSQSTQANQSTNERQLVNSPIHQPPDRDNPAPPSMSLKSNKQSASMLAQSFAATSTFFAVGDIFAGRGDGKVEWRHPDGSLNQILDTGQTGFVTGMAFDSLGNLYATNFSGNKVTKFDSSGNLVGTFGSGYNCDPESMLFDQGGNAYVGQADCSRAILKFSSSGALIDSFTPAVENRGTDWIDLAGDQCTMFYTSEGTSVKRFDVCANTQLPDFATGLPGGAAFALRLISGGGMLVAASDRVVRLNSSGSVIQTYTAMGETTFFALNLDPDGTSFWSAGLSSGSVYKFNIATGAHTLVFTAATSVGGLAILGEITASQSCNIVCPADITRPNDSGQCGGVANYTPPSATNCAVVCSPPPDAFFPIGATTVTCTATATNVPPEVTPPPPSTCSFTVTVADTEAPKITCPTSAVVQCSDSTAAKYQVPAVSDNCPGATITCSPPPDSTSFKAGTTTVVNCVARDQAANVSGCAFQVTIGDIIPPTITSCPSGIVPIANPQGLCNVPIDVTSLVSASDNCASSSSLTKSQIPTTGVAGTTQTVTVTVKDAAGLQTSCQVTVAIAAGAPGSLKVSPENVDLGTVKLFGKQKKNKKKFKPAATEKTFTVQNAGCGPLTISPRTFTRITDAGKMNPDDSKFFKVTLGNGQPFTSLTLNAGAPPVELKVTFSPSVPGISSCTSQVNPGCLNASNVLPNSFQSALSFIGTDKTVIFTANVDKGVKLVDPANPSSASGLVQLCRSGDEFTITYFVFDSDMSDIKSVKYEFLDSSDKAVKVIDNVDLAGPLSKAGLVNGMSFKVKQTFSGAKDNDNVTKVRVTVTGGGSSAQGESSGSSDCGTQVQTLFQEEFTTLLLPARKLYGVEL